MTINKFITSCLLLLLILSCKEKDRPTDNIFKFKDFINYTSSGRISVADHIEIGLTQAINGWEEGKVLDASLVSFSPRTDGELKVLSARQLAFYPAEDLRPNTEYTVQLKLNDLFEGIEDEFKTYTFKFKTIEPNFSVNTAGLQSYSKDWQYLSGTIRLADQTPFDKVRTLIDAEQNGKSLSIKWDDESQKGRFFSFRIDSIQRAVEDSEISVSWNGKPIKSENSGKQSITIPGQNNFKVVDVSVHREPEQHIRVNFSDPLDKQQNFNGLISLGGSNQLTYTVDGNVLNVHSSQSLTGTMNLEVFQGILNTSGFKLKDSYYEDISFEPVKPAIRSISGNGILPNSSDLNYNFEAVNLKAVDVRIIKVFEDNVLQFLQENQLSSDARYSIKRVGRRISKETISLNDGQNLYPDQWKAYSLDLSEYFQADPGAIYRIEVSYKQEYSLYECEGELENTEEEDEALLALAETEEDLTEEAYWDNQLYNYGRYYYNWQERDNPCHPAYYHEDRQISANLVASNLGMIAKRGTNNSYYFAVNNILDTEPVNGAEVTIYNYQQQPIASNRTDGDGMTIIDADKLAYFATVQKGNEISYLKLNDGQALSLSKFDISGKTLDRGLKGYIFGERGVWRPGDSLHLAFILDDKANPLPNGHPVKFELTDPSGRLKVREIRTVNKSGFHRFSIPTSTEDQTGNWNARLSLGGVNFSKSLKVETIKPNRLKIDLKFEDEVLSTSKKALADLQVNWLHGAPAKNVRSEIKAKFSSTGSGFEAYKDYKFLDPTRIFRCFYSHEALIGSIFFCEGIHGKITTTFECSRQK